jgi:4'-phosphopantetheinyl transferase EntD
MGVIINDFIESDCQLGFWEITESFDNIYSMVSLNEEDKNTLISFKNESRQIEWLSVRALLTSILRRDVRIVYNEEHKPFLNDNSLNISISHSNRLTSVLLSKHQRVGIDIEFMSHRISRIAHKFINSREFITPDKTLEKLHLYIHWCAKEALYKICDKQNINFKENLTIQPFELEKAGSIIGIHHNVGIHEEFTMNYKVFDNYAIVYCTK